MKRRAAVLLFAMVAAVGLCMGPAAATGHRHHGDVLVVDDNHDPASCDGRHADFDSIQKAIDAPDTGAGDTILVCPGEYKETVRVTKAHLTIKGAKAGHDATRRDRKGESVVTHIDPEGTVQLREDDIRWDGFTIRGILGDDPNGPGMYTSPDHSGYDIRDTIFEENGIGLYLGSSGDRTTIVCRNRFIANNEFEGTGGANGIYSDEGARDVSIVSNRFERHNGSGILFADSTTGIRQRDIRVGWNKSIDDKSFATFFATARLRLHRNVVRARVNDPDFPDRATAIFIGARNDDVIVSRNRVQSASGDGIDVSQTGQFNPAPPPTNVTLLRNWVEHAQKLGISVTALGRQHYEVRGNRAFNNTEVGLHLGLGTADAFVIGNKALGNSLDCQDLSRGDGTAGTDNTWQKDLGDSAEPGGICSPPTGPPPHHGGGHHHHRPKKHRDPCRCHLPWRL